MGQDYLSTLRMGAHHGLCGFRCHCMPGVHDRDAGSPCESHQSLPHDARPIITPQQPDRYDHTSVGHCDGAKGAAGDARLRDAAALPTAITHGACRSELGGHGGGLISHCFYLMALLFRRLSSGRCLRRCCGKWREIRPALSRKEHFGIFLASARLLPGALRRTALFRGTGGAAACAGPVLAASICLVWHCWVRGRHHSRSGVPDIWQ
mmetsp:Transcript_62751/g.101534  ORF Transcript_62751/g.101534 Transcript_62751/m.101534 type:complete len:208 (-) Transcript_62751:898-1521(-)